MALAPIAPWVVPPDYMGAIKSGASVGTELRGQDIQAGEAADRLRLAYDQLAAQEDRSAREAAAKLALAEQGQQLRAHSMNMLDQYRQGLLANQEQRMKDLSDYREESLKQKQDLAEAANQLRSRNIHFGTNGEVLKLNDDGTVKVLREARPPAASGPTASFPLDPNNPFGPKITGKLSEPEISKRFAEATAAPPPAPAAQPSAFSLLHPSTWFGGPAPAPGATPATAPAPYKEGAMVRNKKDGKLYQVINGMPVEVPEGNSPEHPNEP